MRNIWKIFTTDVKGLVKNPFALIIAVGLCVLPSLYAWFNIYANWDPYANTSGIAIAVVSEDAGYTLSDGTQVNMGEQVVEQLEENESIGWVAVDSAEDALDGVYSGTYYAAVVVTENFSYSMYNVFREEFAGPTIIYYENEKKNAIGTKITDTAVSTLKQSINEQFIQVVSSTIFEQTNSLSSEMQEGDAFDNFQTKLANLNDNLIGYSKMIDTLLESNAALSATISDVNDEIPGMSEKIQNGSDSFKSAQSNMAATRTSLDSFSQNVTQTMDGIKGSIDRITQDINNTNLADSAQKTADSLNQTAQDTAALITQLNDLKNSLSGSAVDGALPEDTKNEIQNIIDTIDSINGGAVDIQGALGGISQNGTDADGAIVADMVKASTDNISQVLTSCSQSVENMKNLYLNTLVPQMNGIMDSMSQMLTNTTNLLDNLNDTLGDMGVVFTGIETTVDGANDSLEQVQTVIDGVSEKLTDLLERLDAAGDDEKVQALISFLGGDPESYGEFFAQPVLVTTEAVYPVENYGSAMTPFYSVLALWVGGTILVALIKVKAEPEGLANVKSYQLYLGRYLLFFVLGQIQALIIVLGDIYLLHVKILYPVLFWLAAALGSLTFTCIIYTFALSFGDIGKAAAVVIMVIQIAGSSGSFPIELLPTIYQRIYIFFPFPYVINAMRETLGGMYGSDYMKYLAELLVFFAAALLVGLVIRLPFVRLNHFMEERMEDTKLM